MSLKLKLIVATVLWMVALASGLAYVKDASDDSIVWAILSAAAAAVVSAMLAGDYIAGQAAKYIVDHIVAERSATVERATRLMQEAGKKREDRVVSRIQSANEAALRRVAGEIAKTLHDDGVARLH